MAKVRDLMTDVSTLPVLTGEDRQAAISVLHETQQCYRPAEPRQIEILMAEFSILPRRNEGFAEAQFKQATYLRQLSSAPHWALRRAVDDWLRTEKWFPTPSEILSFVGQHVGKAKWRETVLTRWLAKEAPRITTDQQAPIPLAEIAAMAPAFRRLGLAKGWITQEQVDAAAEKFPMKEDAA